MIERKNIDRLFQEKFRDFEVNPPEESWNNIESRLPSRDKKRRIIPFWWQLSGVAALIVIGLLFFTQFQDKTIDAKISLENPVSPTILKSVPEVQNQVDEVVADSKSEVLEDKTPEDKIQRTGLKLVKAHGNHSVIADNSDSRNSDRSKNQKLNERAQKPKIDNFISDENQNDQLENRDILEKQNGENLAFSGQSKTSEENIKTDSTQIAVVPNALEELLNEKEKTVTQEQKINRWEIASVVAPVYPGSATNGSTLDSRFEKNEKQFVTTFSYGIGVQYAVSKKLSVRTGINSVALEYSANDIIFSQNMNARKLQNVNTNQRGSMIQIDNMPTQQNSSLNRTIVSFAGDLKQRTSYIEVPVELTYKIIDRRFSFEVIGGVSTLFLSNNEIAIQTSGTEIGIGEANNLNDMHFTTNIGVGLNYEILKAVDFSIEPMFKYQLNAYSENANNFKPYFIGLYSGLTYKF